MNNQELNDQTRIQSGQCGEKLSWTLLDGKLTISGTGDMWEWWEWTVNDNSEIDWESVYEVEIISEVTSIGDFVFSECKNLKNVVISDSVTRIGDSAFKGCTSLKNIYIPESVTDISKSAFEPGTKMVIVPICSEENGYVLSLTDKAMFYLSKKKVRGEWLGRYYEFGVGDDYYYQTYELTLTVNDYFEISDISCYVRKDMWRVEALEIPDKAGMERVSRAVYYPPEGRHIGSDGDFSLYYTQWKLKFEICEGKVDHYYEDHRLEVYYDENDTLLFFIVKLFNKHELSHILAKREEMIEKYDTVAGYRLRHRQRS